MWNQRLMSFPPARPGSSDLSLLPPFLPSSLPPFLHPPHQETKGTLRRRLPDGLVSGYSAFMNKTAEVKIERLQLQTGEVDNMAETHSRGALAAQGRKALVSHCQTSSTALPYGWYRSLR
ncbi:hypothetical protein FQN60_012558 [Etheostoma spectabile]|uniref:Uncharacterized protein n=1 Tax=Etheostoma spectabile TaxID=54343 RepID=A0A5J5DQE3_9PERO|nr:hypothetical protein FQN60_012558 [Etheostoma spectabile]